MFRKDEENTAEGFPLQEPNEDKELRHVCLKTECKPLLGTLRFERFSSWNRLVEGVALLQRLILYRKGDRSSTMQKTSLSRLYNRKYIEKRLPVYVLHCH